MATPEQANSLAVVQQIRDAPVEEHTSQITVFGTDAPTVSSGETNYTQKDTFSTSGIVKSVPQDIVSFLGREAMIATGNFTASDLPNAKLYQVTLPQAVLTSPIFARKVEGFLGFRATINLRIVFNATRFQQGRYGLAAVHTAGSLLASKRTAYITAHSFSLTQTTTLPHVDFDLSCDTEARLKIPYHSAADYCILGSTLPNVYANSEAFLFCYSPLVAGSGSTACGYKIFASFEDVELVFPTQPQSGLRSGTTKKKLPTEMEAEDEGPVSGALSRFSKASKVISEIPILNAIAAPASWVSDVLSRTAWTLGFSSPHSIVPAHRITRGIEDDYTNADHKDLGVKLAVYSNNIIGDSGSPFGTNVDEAHFDYIKSIPSYYKTFNWSTSQPEGTAITYDYIFPENFFTSQTTGPFATNNYTPVCFISKFFRYYRGSIGVRFKVVKTEFHSGRLLVVYNPLESAHTLTPPTPTTISSTYSMRHIIDIRQGNEFEIVFPYMSTTPYRLTEGAIGCYGAFHILVLNPLEAPNTVSSTVSVLCEVFGAPDLEFAAPEQFTEYPVTVFQSGCDLGQTTLGSAKPVPSVLGADSCIGEKVVSFNALLRRFTSWYRIAGDTQVQQRLTLTPFWVSSVDLIQSVPSLSAPLEYPDYFNHIVGCFALARGSIRIKFEMFHEASVPQFVHVVNDSLPASTSRFKPIYHYGSLQPVHEGLGAPACTQKPDINGQVTFEVPYYSPTSSTPVASILGSTYNFYEFDELVPKYQVDVSFSSAIGKNPVILRSAGDDFRVGVFVSIPPYYAYTYE